MITHSELLTHIMYDPESGIMTRRRSRANAATITAKSDVKIDSVNYSAMRLAVFYVTGVYPTNPVVTKDGTANLQFKNLLEVTYVKPEHLTLEILQEHLNYDEYTGIFTCRKRYNTSVNVGDIVGTTTRNKHNVDYVTINFMGTTYQAHRLAWFYCHGYMSEKVIDHIDHNRSNNAISNLREVEHHTNMKNKSKYTTNTSGYPGVDRHGCNWKARIGVNGKKVLLGVFSTFEEAVASRKTAEKLEKYHRNHGK